MKVLHVRKIGIDVITDGEPYIELRIDLHILDDVSGETKQVLSDYERIYKRISQLNPIPIGNVADDGVVDNNELMNLVAAAALTWTALEFNGTFDQYGRVIIE